MGGTKKRSERKQKKEAEQTRQMINNLTNQKRYVLDERKVDSLETVAKILGALGLVINENYIKTSSAARELVEDGIFVEVKTVSNNEPEEAEVVE